MYTRSGGVANRPKSPGHGSIFGYRALVDRLNDDRKTGWGNLGFVQRKVATMRKGFIAGYVLVICLAAATPARAGFVFNYTVTPGDGVLASKNIFQFYAK